MTGSGQHSNGEMLRNGASSNEAPLPQQSSVAQAISADEIALYDRQIRLWGVKAQERQVAAPDRSSSIHLADSPQRLRTASVLVITMRALANEVVKNLVLAGIGSVTILDDHLVTEDDLGSQFLISDQHIGTNRALATLPQVKALNPGTSLQADTENILSKPPEFYTLFDMIIATDLQFETLKTVNAACRLANRPLYGASTHGVYGFIFADLIDHEYVIEREKPNIPTQIKVESATRSIIAINTKKENGKQIEIVTKRELYSPIILANTSPLPSEYLTSRRRKLQVPPLLTCLRALWEFQSLTSQLLPSTSHADLQLFTTLATEKHKELQLPAETLRSDFLRSFLQNLGSEIAPVTAFLGGQVAQDAINVLGQREQPIQNFLLFDGEESKGPVYALHPIFPPIDTSLS